MMMHLDTTGIPHVIEALFEKNNGRIIFHSMEYPYKMFFVVCTKVLFPHIREA